MEQFGSYLGDETRCATVEQVCTVFADGDWIESKDQADDGIRLIQTGNVGNGVYLDKGERARYRWSETEVVRLLDDIYQNGKKNYCLQPVVVRKKGDGAVFGL